MAKANDPTWAHELTMKPEQLWKERAERELKRAQLAEERCERAEEEVRKLTVHAVGACVLDAIKALSTALGWGDVDEHRLSLLDEGPDGAGNGFDWSRRFWAAGTSFKCAGMKLPGGYTITWWK